MRTLSMFALASSLFCQMSYAEPKRKIEFENTTCRTPFYTLEYSQSYLFSYSNFEENNKTLLSYEFEKGDISWSRHFMIFEAYKRALNELREEEKKLEKNSIKLALLKSHAKALGVMTSAAYYKGLKTDDDPNFPYGLYKYYSHQGDLLGTISSQPLSSQPGWDLELFCE